MGTLPKNQHGADDSEERTGAPGQRVDHGQVAHAISTLQDAVVERVQNAAPHDDSNHPRVQRGRTIPAQRQHRGQVEAHGQHGEQPLEDGPASGPLEQKVPGRVNDGGRQEEAKSEKSHRLYSLDLPRSFWQEGEAME